MLLTIGTFSQHYKDYFDDNFYSIKEKIGDQQSIEITVKVLDMKKRILDRDTEQFEDIDLLITHRLTKTELSYFKNLKGIAVPMTGLDNFDKSVLETEGLHIMNVHSLAPFVAERAVGIAMTLLGKIHNQDRDLKQRNWGSSKEQGQWTSFRNKKIGIYGYGAIGKEIENLLKPYHSEFYIIDRNKNYAKNLHLVGDLNELAASCDILFIAVPRSEETEGAVNRDILNKMQDGFIINVGRGVVVNEEDLYQSLVNKTIKGYGADVWFNYPDKEHKEVHVSKHDLSSFDNVVMTPHNSWNTDEQKTLVEDETIENILLLAQKM